MAIGPACPAIVLNRYDTDCVVDDGADGIYGKGQGTVIVIAGIFGTSFYSTDPSDPEAGYFATWTDAAANPSNGFVKYDVSQSTIRAEFMNSRGSFSDRFVLTSTSTGNGDSSGSGSSGE